MSESQEQQALFQWAAIAERQYPELRLLHAIPNSGKRHIITAVRMKAEGQKAGVSDIFLPVARHGFHGLYIELKIKGGRVSPSQADWIKLTTVQGYKSIVCVGWEDARMEIEGYLTCTKGK